MGQKKGKQAAAEALRTLAGNDENKVAIREAGDIPPLVAMVRDGTENGKDTAA